MFAWVEMIVIAHSTLRPLWEKLGGALMRGSKQDSFSTPHQPSGQLVLDYSGEQGAKMTIKTSRF